MPVLLSAVRLLLLLAVVANVESVLPPQLRVASPLGVTLFGVSRSLGAVASVMLLLAFDLRRVPRALLSALAAVAAAAASLSLSADEPSLATTAVALFGLYLVLGVLTSGEFASAYRHAGGGDAFFRVRAAGTLGYVLGATASSAVFLVAVPLPPAMLALAAFTALALRYPEPAEDASTDVAPGPHPPRTLPRLVAYVFLLAALANAVRLNLIPFFRAAGSAAPEAASSFAQAGELVALLVVTEAMLAARGGALLALGPACWPAIALACAASPGSGLWAAYLALASTQWANCLCETVAQREAAALAPARRRGAVLAGMATAANLGAGLGAYLGDLAVSAGAAGRVTDWPAVWLTLAACGSAVAIIIGVASRPRRVQ